MENESNSKCFPKGGSGERINDTGHGVCRFGSQGTVMELVHVKSQAASPEKSRWAGILDVTLRMGS